MVSHLVREATILCQGCLCGSCSPSGVVCLVSDIVKVKTGQSKVMSMLGNIDSSCLEWVV